MAKPIFIIKMPYDVGVDENKEINNLFNENPKGKELNEEYHTLAVIGNGDKFEFEVLNSDKADEVTMEKVKEIELLITKNINDGRN